MMRAYRQSSLRVHVYHQMVDWQNLKRTTVNILISFDIIKIIRLGRLFDFLWQNMLPLS